MLMAIRSFARPIVLTRADNMIAIRAWMGSEPGLEPEFIIVDEPNWAPRARKSRVFAFLMYLSWLRRAEAVAREVIASGRIDLVHHVTYSAYWLPNPAVRLGVPSVLGPIGGAVTTPEALIDLLGVRGRVTEWIDRWAVRIAEALPATRQTWRDASIRIVQNEETLRRIERVTNRPSILFNHAVLHVVDSTPTGDGEGVNDYVLWLSAMQSRKGPELAVRALVKADPSVRLVMAGDGPERPRIQRLATKLGVQDRIEFLGRVDHDRALQLMKRSNAAIFTGMREEGGLALAEALYIGTPTIVLDHGGPSTIARAAIDPDQVTLVSVESQQRTITELAQAMSLSLTPAPGTRKPILDLAVGRETLRKIYAGVLEAPANAAVHAAQTVQPVTRKVEADDPAISIVMPAYNAESFICESIESVLDQTLTGFELIIVEDGSSDRTWEIVQKYASEDQRITAMRNDTNMGIARTLNRGISVARAALIGRLDADDIAVPDRFERQLAMMRAHPDIVVVGSNALHINENNQILGLSIAGPTSIEDFHQRRAAGKITMVLDGTSVIRRSIFQLAGRYDPAMDAAPEVDLHSRMAEYGVVVALDEPLVLYRLHTGSNVDATFFAGRLVHRFVATCEQARILNEPRPTFEEFRAQEAAAPVWRRARNHLKDTGQFRYRAAGVRISEGQMLAGMTNLTRAFLVSPRFVATRLWHRRLSPTARRRMRDAELRR
jgi:glycosyltransferase involved in cell wall biosynthesis